METFEDKQGISALLEIYGGLLTERQRVFMELHFNEDLSYGEIAETENISRQAVHDTIQHGKKALQHFEEELKLLEKRSTEPTAPVPADGSNAEPWQDVRARVDELCKMLHDDILYDTHKVRKKLHELRDLVHASR